tara:strand:- start:267 stop:665 length:399 start_codon:yes stop_codon:yes gene_type:complete
MKNRPDLERNQKTVDNAFSPYRIPNSQIRSRSDINTSQENKGKKTKFKSNVRSTIEAHDTEGNKKGVKTYIDTKQETIGSKSKFKQFSGTEGEKGYQRKINKRGKERSRRLTKGGTKRRIASAEEYLKEVGI